MSEKRKYGQLYKGMALADRIGFETIVLPADTSVKVLKRAVPLDPTRRGQGAGFVLSAVVAAGERRLASYRANE